MVMISSHVPWLYGECPGCAASCADWTEEAASRDPSRGFGSNSGDTGSRPSARQASVRAPPVAGHRSDNARSFSASCCGSHVPRLERARNNAHELVLIEWQTHTVE